MISVLSASSCNSSSSPSQLLIVSHRGRIATEKEDTNETRVRLRPEKLSEPLFRGSNASQIRPTARNNQPEVWNWLLTQA